MSRVNHETFWMSLSAFRVEREKVEFGTRSGNPVDRGFGYCLIVSEFRGETENTSDADMCVKRNGI